VGAVTVVDGPEPDEGDELQRVLDEAREAPPPDRLPVYRDAIARFGSAAIEPLATWIETPPLAGFAIRTIERIATLVPEAKHDAVIALAWLDRDGLDEATIADLDASLRAMGVDLKRAARGRTAFDARPRPTGTPGVTGRNYWAMRTSPWERPYIWAEAQAGRLRQGWSWSDDQDLDAIARRIRAGGELSDEQQMAWPSRRMLSTEPDGMRTGDLILTPNLPELGRVSVFRLIGSYTYSPDAPRRFEDRFGHVLPVELLAADIDRRAEVVSDALRMTMRTPSRLWSITPYGGDVELLVNE
jgi:hypothetical protein